MGTSARDREGPDLDVLAGSLSFYSRELRKAEALVPSEEVEDVVGPRVDSCLKCRPCDGRECRQRRPQPCIAPLLLELTKIRELSLCHVSLKELRIEPIETQNDYALYARILRAPVPAQEQPQVLQRPKQDRNDTEDNSEKKHRP